MCWLCIWLNHSHADIEPYCTPTDSGFWFKLFHVLNYFVSPLHLQWMYFLRDFDHYHCWSKTDIPYITSCVQPTKLQAPNSNSAFWVFTASLKHVHKNIQEHTMSPRARYKSNFSSPFPSLLCSSNILYILLHALAFTISFPCFSNNMYCAMRIEEVGFCVCLFVWVEDGC